VSQPAAGSYRNVELFETLLKPLVNAPQPPRIHLKTQKLKLRGD